MIRPLVLSRQPCITPGCRAGLGERLGRQRRRAGAASSVGRGLALGFGGERLRTGRRRTARSPPRSATASMHASQHTVDRPAHRMPARLRSRAPTSAWQSTRLRDIRQYCAGKSAAQIPDSRQVALTLAFVTSPSALAATRRLLGSRPARSASLVDPEDDLPSSDLRWRLRDHDDSPLQVGDSGSAPSTDTACCTIPSRCRTCSRSPVATPSVGPRRDRTRGRQDAQPPAGAAPRTWVCCCCGSAFGAVLIAPRPAEGVRLVGRSGPGRFRGLAV